MTTAQSFQTSVKPTWCPGCGNFGIWLALKNALAKLQVPYEKIVLVYGIGCHGNMRDWMRCYALEGLHGRALPAAQGVKLADPSLTVIAIMGDGDCLGEGGNHFIQAAKRNPNITAIIHNNEVYGLTTGQASPTAQQGLKTKSTPEGVQDVPFNPLALAVTAGASFAARGFSGDMAHLTDLLAASISHKGFSVVDVLQPCVTFDKVRTYQYYREHTYKVEAGYDPKNTQSAMQKVFERDDRIPLGILYQQDRPTQEDREKGLEKGPLSTAAVSFDREEMLSLFH